MSFEADDNDLLVTLEQRIVVQAESAQDAYDDNYIRHLSGQIWLVDGESGARIEIGSIELYYIDGTRALDSGLDIVDVCDSLGQEVYEYAKSVYVNGVLNADIARESFSNDVLALHSIAIFPEYRGRKYGLRVTKKIVETIGYQCGAAVLKPSPLQFSAAANCGSMNRMELSEFVANRESAVNRLTDYWRELDLRETRDPTIFIVGR